MADKATRDAFGEAIIKAGEFIPNIVVVSCDLSDATKTKQFAERFPERFFEVGIAEQNGIGIAAGLAMEGFRPFISSFGAFITGRYDQIRISCAYNDAGVVIVGTHSGLAIGKDGATQMGIEDINIMSGVPRMQIFQPADDIETMQIVNYLARSSELAYLRISRQPQPSVHDANFMFKFNKGETLQSGKDISLFSTGDSVWHCLVAAQRLESKGIHSDVVNFSTLKPIDEDLILDYANKRKAIFSIEDHSIIGGLGSRVCEVVAEAGVGIPVTRIGIKDCFGESGAPADLYRQHKLDVDGIVEQVCEHL